jgi:hypothetical protein
MEKNLSFQSNKKFNVENLKEINDDKFWKETLPKMISYFLENHKQVKNCIPTLVYTKNSKAQVIITRGQALVILISLFLAIMPKNPLSKQTRSFGEFMTKMPHEKYPEIRL